MKVWPKVPWKFQILHHISDHPPSKFVSISIIWCVEWELLNISSIARPFVRQSRRWCFTTNIQSRLWDHYRQSSTHLTIYRTMTQKIGQFYSLYLTAAAARARARAPTKMSFLYLACVLLMVLLSTLEVESYSVVPNSSVSKTKYNDMSYIVWEWLADTAQRFDKLIWEWQTNRSHHITSHLNTERRNQHGEYLQAIQRIQDVRKSSARGDFHFNNTVV